MLRCALKAFNKGLGTLPDILHDFMEPRNKDADAGKIRTQRGSGLINSADTLLPGVNPAMRAEGYSMLIDYYEAIRAFLIKCGRTDPTDGEIAAKMLDGLEPQYESFNDYSLSGLPRCL